MKRKTIDIITLGCSKNLVDSEQLMRQLEEAGYNVTHDAEKPEGEIAVINTCGFIGDAKEESINMILEFAQEKEEGNLEKLFVMGCLSERYLQELAIEIPQVDKFYGKFNWKELLQDLGKAYHDELYIERTLTTPEHYAYLKISEGCDRKCSYCAIPIITGRHVSRPMEEILEEVKYLVSRGVKEFQVIAQELTYYGVDLYKKQMLPELIECISEIPGVMEGDKVTLLGVDGTERITAEELGELSGRFNYEFVCDLGKRIPRVYRQHGEITEVRDYFENF